MSRFYRRKKQGRKFNYYLNEDKVTDHKVIERINSLVIPPAWTDVNIAMSSTAKVQATGRDKAGRTQAIYHPTYRARQEKEKFERILRFGERLPALRKQMEKDLLEPTLSKDKVLACVVKLMDEAYFRVGNKNYAKENQTYGITTMRRKHTTIKSTQVIFDFVGKSGQEHVKTINDRQIAKIIKQLDELPGYEVFQYIGDDKEIHPVDSGGVNEYIKEHMGEEFTAKDFRTWGGTLTAATELALSESGLSKSDKEIVVTECVKKVAKQLGNTPAIARGSYIDVRVVNAYMKTDALAEFAETVANMRPRKYVAPEETCTLELLRQYS